MMLYNRRKSRARREELMRDLDSLDKIKSAAAAKAMRRQVGDVGALFVFCVVQV